MSVEMLMNELRKAPDEISREKILFSWALGRETELKTRIPKEDVIPVSVLEALTQNKRYTKDCGLKMTMMTTNNILVAIKKNAISQDGLSRAEMVQVLVAERQRKEDGGARDRWLGKD